MGSQNQNVATSRADDEARISAEIRATRLGRPSGVVRPATIDRRIQQHEATSSARQ